MAAEIDHFDSHHSAHLTIHYINHFMAIIAAIMVAINNGYACANSVSERGVSLTEVCSVDQLIFYKTSIAI
jgi:hypothetical protein